MPYKEKEIEKLYYTIGEVAQIFGVNTSHIRFWSNEFDVIRPATNKKGNRLYTREDIDNFRKIYHLVKEKGFTLRGAKTELKDMRQRVMIEETSSLAPATDVMFDDLELVAPTVSISEPVDQDRAVPALSHLYNEDLVDRMAIQSSLEKIRSGLLELRTDLSRIVN
jgi:DNA-binding transcriptional MerR regulator